MKRKILFEQTSKVLENLSMLLLPCSQNITINTPEHLEEFDRLVKKFREQLNEVIYLNREHLKATIPNDDCELGKLMKLWEILEEEREYTGTSGDLDGARAIEEEIELVRGCADTLLSDGYISKKDKEELEDISKVYKFSLDIKQKYVGVVGKDFEELHGRNLKNPEYNNLLVKFKNYLDKEKPDIIYLALKDDTSIFAGLYLNELKGNCKVKVIIPYEGYCITTKRPKLLKSLTTMADCIIYLDETDDDCTSPREYIESKNINIFEVS